MKKIFLMCLALMIVFLLTACGTSLYEMSEDIDEIAEAVYRLEFLIEDTYDYLPKEQYDELIDAYWTAAWTAFDLQEKYDELIEEAEEDKEY